MRIRLAAVPLAGLLALLPGLAYADDPEGSPNKSPPPAAGATAAMSANASASGPVAKPVQKISDETLAAVIDRPHTIAEFEGGIIALPTAPISAGQRGGSVFGGTIGRGDATLTTGLHVLYRWNRMFAVGAGVLFSPIPSTDTRVGLPNLPRTHARSYFFLGGEGRYIPIHINYFEAWVGVSVGGVVVGDRFTTNAGDEIPPIVGTKEATVRTEGFAIGAQVGATYYLSANWIAGASLRAYGWFLPSTQRCSSIGDCATLSGTVEALELGLTIGYRLPL